jgi:phosphatidyl-myo-inositol alpha-mannosyltransferase
MKIGIVVPYSWSFWGGVQEHADHQARSLIELGLEAKILMGHDPPGRITKLLHPKEGRHGRPPDYVIPVGRSVIVPANDSLPNIILSPQAMVRVRRTLEQERFDVLHVHEPFTPVLAAYAIAATEGPVVATFHAAGEELGWYPIAKALWGFVMDRIDYRIAVSEAAKQSAGPYVNGPMELIPNGVRLPERWNAGGRNGNVVFIGRVERRKGLEVLLAAWPRVLERTGARLRVVGADPLQVRWHARRYELPLDGVDLLGGVSEETLSEELSRASLLVAPSLGGESFGMVLTRAFASATPVVASDIPGYAAVAGPETGILVPPGDKEALTAAIVELLEDEPRRRRLGESARRAAEPYSWTKIARRLVSIYEDLLNGRSVTRQAA